MNATFALRLASLTARRPVTVLGAAVVDVIADAYALPWRGCDIELKQQGVNIGGCALNIAIALKRLDIPAQNALPVGHGVWADMIRQAMTRQGVHTAVEAETGDNGWCLALVEPDGERTFMSFSGVENQWQQAWLDALKVPPQSLVYLSGYQLASPSAALLTRWLEGLESVTPFIDFGPRIEDISDDIMTRIMACKPIVSLNRHEAELAAGRLGVETASLGSAWQAHYGSPLIVRYDKDGAAFYDGEHQGHVPAFSATVVDTIGAGDSHAGGTLAGLAAGWTLEEAVRLGNAVGAWVVSHRGGDCAPTREALLLAYENV